MDWYAIVSNGVYPDTAVTNAQRAMYAVSYGLIGATTGSLQRTFYTVVKNCIINRSLFGSIV